MNQEKKFKKKKERERAVRKKILFKRAISRAASRENRKREKLEHEVNKSGHEPIRKVSPEFQKVVEILEKVKDSDETSEVTK